MEHAGTHRAVAAGIAGVVTALAPTPALAATGVPDSALYARFALGCVTGAILSGSVALVIVWRARASASDASRDTSRPNRGDTPVTGRHVRRPVGVDPYDRGLRVQSADFFGERNATLGVGGTEADESSTPSDYTEVAERYVRHQTMASRMAVRAAGVRDTLISRLGGDLFDDLPVIERADGTVGDVGTGWWETRTGDRLRRAHGDGAPSAPATTAPLNAAARAAARQARGNVDPRGVATVFASKRSAYIAHRVAEVDLGAFPARRSAAELDPADTFAQALAAMDEQLAPYAAVPVRTVYAFADAVGGVETIDDPSGLEPVTGFLSFRVPAGHPEVVDQDSYVDYLIADEFAANPSSAARRGPSYLRVIQGGSKPPVGVGRGDIDTAARSRPMRGRHFRRELESVAL